MKKHYDFSDAKRNPYAKRLKKQVTIRLEESTLAYFKQLASELAIPYQTLINMYLKDCQVQRKQLRLEWTSSVHSTSRPR
jgi:predicted DNA binding CopG/RHH family protein